MILDVVRERRGERGNGRERGEMMLVGKVAGCCERDKGRGEGRGRREMMLGVGSGYCERETRGEREGEEMGRGDACGCGFWML